MKPSTKLQVKKIKELCFLVLIVIKQFFNAVFAAAWGLTGIWAFILLSNYLGFDFNISSISALYVVTYLYVPLCWIISSVFEINEYVNSKKK